MRWKWPGADSDSASFTLVFVVPAKPKSFGVLWHSGHIVRAAAIAWLVIATLSVGRAVLIHYPRQLIFRFPAFAVLGFVLPFGF